MSANAFSTTKFKQPETYLRAKAHCLKLAKFYTLQGQEIHVTVAAKLRQGRGPSKTHA